MSNDEFPAFSVLMSVYKKEKPAFLDQALESIEDQTVKPNQIVVVVDGPIESELDAVLKEHQNQNADIYTIVRSKRNQGLGLALRMGTEYCEYDWIARMDSDDVSVSNRFELQLKAVVKDPHLAIVGGQIDEFMGGINHITGKRLVPIKQEDIYQFVKWRSPFNHPSVMLNKKAILDVGNYQANGKLEDYFLWSKVIIGKYPVLNLSEVLVHMRVDTGMYGRRGEWANLKQIFKLRRMLYKGKLVSKREELTGDFVMVANVIVPAKLRELIYKKVLHK